MTNRCSSASAPCKAGAAPGDDPQSASAPQSGEARAGARGAEPPQRRRLQARHDLVVARPARASEPRRFCSAPDPSTSGRLDQSVLSRWTTTSTNVVAATLLDPPPRSRSAWPGASTVDRPPTEPTDLLSCRDEHPRAALAAPALRGLRGGRGLGPRPRLETGVGRACRAQQGRSDGILMRVPARMQVLLAGHGETDSPTSTWEHSAGACAATHRCERACRRSQRASRSTRRTNADLASL
jgi:hypothetical protein